MTTAAKFSRIHRLLLNPLPLSIALAVSVGASLLFYQFFTMIYSNAAYVMLIVHHCFLIVAMGVLGLLITLWLAHAKCGRRLKVLFTCLASLLLTMLLRYSVYYIIGTSVYYDTMGFFFNPFTGMVELVRSLVNLVEFVYYGNAVEALLSLLGNVLFCIGFYLPVAVPLLYHFWFLPSYVQSLRRESRQEHDLSQLPPACLSAGDHLDTAQWYLLTNGRFFPAESLVHLEVLLRSMTPEQWRLLPAVRLREPGIHLLVSILLGGVGVDRFLLGDRSVGLLKLLTVGGCGVLFICDWFTAESRTREQNLRQVEKLLE